MKHEIGLKVKFTPGFWKLGDVSNPKPGDTGVIVAVTPRHILVRWNTKDRYFKYRTWVIPNDLTWIPETHATKRKPK